MKSCVVALILSLFAPLSIAGYTVSTYINRVSVLGSGVVIIDVSVVSGNQPQGFPSCATFQRYAFDATTAGGKVMYKTLLTALRMGKHVQIYGTHTCDVESNSETLSSFLTLD